VGQTGAVMNSLHLPRTHQAAPGFASIFDWDDIPKLGQTVNKLLFLIAFLNQFEEFFG
jgi:hypothetical protein